MATWTVDPSFYPSPRMAMKAKPETIAYVAAFDPDRKTPDALAVVDVDPRSGTYSTIVGTTSVGTPVRPVSAPTPRMRMPSVAISSFPG